ncbi:UDP-N-acetylmuramoyl-L-alanyl-D-glutamate--2,6-diaminopimelate ligase, partial [Streptococcus danieliae]|nr:UDP-N-acetylmuramoyl-L-alanyl-D-glutamate--2,6-diaminopimelate ligase [Streptococcus danieliae]
MNVKKIIKDIKIKKIYGEIPNEVSSISADSRKIKKDSVFVATVGYRVDGHNFINKAVEQGAILIIAS